MQGLVVSGGLGGEQGHEGREHLLHVLAGLLGSLPALAHEDAVGALDDDSVSDPLGLSVGRVGGDSAGGLVEGFSDSAAVVGDEPARVNSSKFGLE